MKPITKNSASQLDTWEAANATVIQHWMHEIACGSKSANEVWKYINIAIKASVRQELMDEQGHICAYCGQRITISTGTKIEHLEIKSIFYNLIFKYSNLSLCCIGGERKRREVTQPSETFSMFMTRMHGLGYNISEEVIVLLNPDPAVVTAIESGTVLPEGYLLLVEDQHCDTKRGDNPSPILNPTQHHDCDLRFVYDDEGRMTPASTSDTRAADTLTTLGLDSNDFLRRGRKNAYYAADQRKLDIEIEASQLIAAGQLSEENLLDYIKNIFETEKQAIYTRDSLGMFSPFCFVPFTYFYRQLETLSTTTP